MKAMTIERYGKKVPLIMTERPMPTIGEHDVLVEIYAASLNPIDFKIKEGKVKLLLKYEFPLILGNDFSGVVIKVGTRVNAFKPGDEIYGRPRKDRIGTLAEYMAIHEEDISLKPRNLSFEEAASIPLVGLTTRYFETSKRAKDFDSCRIRRRRHLRYPIGQIDGRLRRHYCKR